MLALMLLATLSTAPDPLAGDTLVRFSRKVFRRHATVEVAVGRIEGDPHAPPRYWLRRTSSDPAETVAWIDTQRCPAAVAVLRDGAALETPRPVVPGLVDPGGEPGVYLVVADGATYGLTTGAAYGDLLGTTLSLSSGTGTPLADWVEASLTTLEPCWSPTPPDGVGSD